MTTAEKIQYCEDQIKFLKSHMGKHNATYPDSSFREAITFWEKELTYWRSQESK